MTTALTGANLEGIETTYSHLLLFLLSITVTITVGIMNLCKFEDVFWKKRVYAEKFKREGFNFLQLIGNYRDYPDHTSAYKFFAMNIENLINEVNEGYLNVFGRNKQSQEERIKEQ